jgi:hypothetical protein
MQYDIQANSCFSVVKVLYTFDDQNKTNCLARWPQVLQIRTVAMDETTSIGVIELKTCIQAIVQCSPELVAKLGQDYTVYAYDYSEYDNPLVGQGMLSWALAAASPTPDAPAHQSRQLITGRVCKNIQGLFSNGVAETLEVKLRLVPVPTVLQSEYLSSMEKYRELSKVMPPGFDHNEWFSFLQSNPNIAQMAHKVNGPVPTLSGQREGFSMEVVNQLLSPSLTHNSTDPFNNPQNSNLGPIEGGDPAPVSSKKAAQNTSRPSSRASVKRPYKRRTKAVVTGGNTSGYEEGTDGDDGPTTKKRAKITKADWNSKSSFGSTSESLRVTASTAGSLRLFRPIALAPAPAPSAGSHLQEIPRAPTPVPGMSSQAPNRDRAPSQSSLRRDSIASQYMDPQQRQYSSPYQQPGTTPESQEQIQLSIEPAMTSPEGNDSQADTPPEFGSSPPVLRTASPHQFSPAPSSPILPQMPRTDSGFMSGDLNELFDDEDEMRPVQEEDIAVPKKYNRRKSNHRPAPPRPEIHHGFAIEEVTPGPPELLPTKMLPRNPRLVRAQASILRTDSTMSDDGIAAPEPKTQPMTVPQTSATPDVAPVMPAPTVVAEVQPALTEAQNSPRESREFPGSISEAPLPAPPVARPASRMLSRTASIGSLTLPTVAASDQLPPDNPQSEAPHPVTDMPAPSDQPERTVVVSAGTIAKKNAIRQKLENAIANGERPPFCSNCGAIETPAWRKAFTQDFKGDPGYHEYSDEPGRVTAIDILERDQMGRPTAFKIFKKYLAPGEDKVAFTEVILCNREFKRVCITKFLLTAAACGIWLSKYKTQRPEDKWEKDKERQNQSQTGERRPAERKKRERSSKSKKAQTGYQGDATSEAYFQSDAPPPVDHRAANEASQDSQHQTAPTSTEQQDTESFGQRASSVRPVKRTMKAMTSESASAALKRAIQSSPARWLGTRHSPIELDEDLGSTRRLLFPSPRKDEGSNVFGEVATNVVQPPVSFHSPHSRNKDLAVETADKENCPPTPLFDDGDEELRKLFEEELLRLSRPTTPVQNSTRPSPFKTPTRPTPNHRPITRSISKSSKSTHNVQMLPQRTPSKTPSTAARRRSPRNHQSVAESPFTATLNKILSEANDNHGAANISPSRHLDFGLDFSNLPDLGHSGADGLSSDALTFQMPGFDPNHDFFSTDIPMPSSPPRLFDFYEDPLAMGTHEMDNMESSLWSDFNMDDGAMQGLGPGLVIDANGHANLDMGTKGQEELPNIKVEATETSGRKFHNEAELEVAQQN